MMFKHLVIIALTIVGIVAQTVNVQFYAEEGCDDDKIGAECEDLPTNECCGSDELLWTSISTTNWQNVAEGTEVRVEGIQDGDFCAVFLANIEEGECLIVEIPDVISGTDFFDGMTRRRRGTPDASAAASVAKNCTNRRGFDAYFYQPGDGFKYSIDATDATHITAFGAANSSEAKAQYIMANFDKKVAVKAPTKVVRGSA